MIKRYWQSAIRRTNQIPINKKRQVLYEKYPELKEMFDKYMSLFHEDGGFKYAVQDIKVLQLLDILIEKKAKNVVEYGTGSTSLACAYYSTNYNKQYLGLDENEKWANLNSQRLKDIIPKVKNIKIMHSPRVDEYSEDVYYTSMEYHPDRYFDFMIIDGPSFNLNEDHKFKVNNDLIKYLEKGLPETIVVDNRKTTVKWLKTFLKDSHTCRESTYWQVRKKVLRADTFNYFSIFEKISS